jgi:hypothetical protein
MKCFMTYAWDHHVESTWNPDTHEVDSPDSQRISGLQEVDPELLFKVTNIKAISQPTSVNSRPTPTNQQQAFPEFEANPDDESCRTFGRLHSTNTLLPTNSDAPSRVSAMSSGTNSSFVTLEDFEKRLAFLDTKNHERSSRMRVCYNLSSTSWPALPIKSTRSQVVGLSGPLLIQRERTP